MAIESSTQRKKRLQQELFKKNIHKDVHKPIKSTSYMRRIVCIMVVIAGAIRFSTRSSNHLSSPEDAFVIQTGDHVKGSASGKVVLIEYLDFECEVCKTNYPILKQLAEEFSGDLQLVVRYFPLLGHENSMAAAAAVESAARQGKFWEMHNILLEKQNERGNKEKTNIEIFIPYAEEVGLNMDKFYSDVVSDSVIQKIEKDKELWTAIWVQGTPAFFLNGEKIQNPRSIEEFRTLIKAEILKNPKIIRGDKTHEHADYKVFINNREISFSGDRYQSTTGKQLSESQHLHDNNGNNIHKHLTKNTIPNFFESLGIFITADCIQMDDGQKYCSDGTKTLKFFVNDKAKKDFMSYEFKDLDRILISYGSETWQQMQAQLDAVTDMSCMYSDKCPERGKPPTENCIVGLGGDC